MGFSNQERINLFTKALAAGVYDANATAVWYESKFPFTFILSGTSIWTNLSGVPVAGNLATARSNASSNPTIIQDKSQNADAIRLTLVAGTNDSTYAAYSTYNDTTSAVLKNWILPQLVPQTSGAPSNGYAISLYNGDPNAGGTLVTTTEGTTGTGINKTVGWIFNYASGILILADDFSSSITDPYILGFRYIGSTAEDTSSTTAEKVQNSFTADETIAATELVRFVNSSDSGLTPGRVMKARSSELVIGEFCGIATSGGGQGDSINVATEGKVAVKFSSSVASTNNGKAVYVSDTDGVATTVAPSTPTNAVYKIGTLVGADGSTTTPTVKLSFQEIIIIG